MAKASRKQKRRKVYVEEGTDKAELYKATSGKTKVTAKKVTDKMSAEIGDKA